MALKTSELNARLFGKTDKRRVSTMQAAQTAAKENVQFIELAIAGEKVVQFELVKIRADQVAVKTKVFAENAREQSFLNEHALADILTTLKDRGQQYPAVGRYDRDGNIEILDGSRRRMACILAGKEFLVYVGSNINEQHAKFLSDVANAHKPLSLYEKGKEMQTKLLTKEAFDQKELAKIFQCSEALVSGALKAAALPLELLQVYPNVSDLGRPTIVKLHREFFNLTKDQQKQLLMKCEELRSDLISPANNKISNIARTTKDITEKLEMWINQLNTAKLSGTSNKIDLVKARASYTRKGDNLTLTLKKVDDKLMRDILNYIKEKII